MTLAEIQHALGLGCLTPGLDLAREAYETAATRRDGVIKAIVMP